MSFGYAMGIFAVHDMAKRRRLPDAQGANGDTAAGQALERHDPQTDGAGPPRTEERRWMVPLRAGAARRIETRSWSNSSSKSLRGSASSGAPSAKKRFSSVACTAWSTKGRAARTRYRAASSDIDIVYVTGYGFPAYRGGPMYYADQIGLASVYADINASTMSTVTGGNPPLLAELARNGRRFSDWSAAA